MEEYINQILEYLPVEFADDEANEFIKYLEEAYLENIQNQKYQFAFKAFHLLYMTFVYKMSWFLKCTNNEPCEEKIHKIKTKNNGLSELKEETISIQRMFEYSLINESNAIDKLLKKAGFGFNANDFDKCQRHIEARNHCSHASGKIEYDEKGIDFLISDELKYIERLQNKIKPELEKIFIEYLNNWESSTEANHWIIQNHLSRKDLEIIINFDLPLFKEKSDNEETILKKRLYLVFVNEAQKYLELDKNVFLEKLPMFTLELKDEIEITKEKDLKEIVETKTIIERDFLPIINGFSDAEKEKSKEILGKFIKEVS